MVDESGPDAGSKQALDSNPLPAVYFNGFDLNSSLSDMTAGLILNGRPQLLLYMSFTTAKTLAAELTKMVQTFEEATGHDVMVMDEVKQGYERAAKSDG